MNEAVPPFSTCSPCSMKLEKHGFNTATSDFDVRFVAKPIHFRHAALGMPGAIRFASQR